MEGNLFFFTKLNNFIRTLVIELSVASIGGHFLVVVCPSKNNSVNKGHR